MRNRFLLLSGAVLMIASAAARPGSALPFDRRAGPDVSPFVLDTLENAPAAQRARLRSRVLAMRSSNAPTEETLVTPTRQRFNVRMLGPMAATPFEGLVAPEPVQTGGVVPEPATGTLLLGGLLTWIGLTRRRSERS